MYFPFFRGRQYELLALKELAQKRLISNSVIPVVEPVKASPTFNGTIKAYNEKCLPIALILNPNVGDLTDSSAITKLLSVVSNYVIPSMILNKNANELFNRLTEQGVCEKEVMAILINRDYLDTYRSLFTDNQPKYTLFPDERQIRRAVSNNKVLFEDKFIKQDKNADYLKKEDEFFSEDHLYFKSEGYVGFGDYSIIGDNYESGGFAPWAVAIHIVYFSDDNTLRIRHFVSDSNDGIEDVAGKFYEAVSKLSTWFRNGQSRQLTSALSTLLSHADSGYYPGLPTIKKLSIMHHLELMGKFLDGGLYK